MLSKLKAAGTLIVTVLLILFSKFTRRSILATLGLCAEVLIPSLFPFFVLSGVIADIGLDALFGVSRGIFLLGTVCGYPLGTRAVCDGFQTGRLSRKEACRLLACTANASPAFLIIAVGQTILRDTAKGIALFAAQFAVSLTIFLLFVPKGQTRSVCRSVALTDALMRNIRAAVSQTGVVVAITICFGIIADAASYWAPAGIKAAAAGFWEITHGVALITPSLPPAVVGAVIGGSGLCVWAQCLYFIRGAGLPARPLVIGKTISAVGVALLYGLYCHLTNLHR